MAEKRELSSFNAVRGLAALAVCASHFRSALFVDFHAVVSPSQFDRIFYFATGLGHQSVVVFFVMSGWLVGGSVCHQQTSGRFSWIAYAIARLSRLWAVLVPALVCTLSLDTFGMQLSSGDGYNGSRMDAIHSGPGGTNPISLSATTFIGNLFFLQTIFVPVLGTNGPLWSLTNEFWYYVIFPLLFPLWALRRQGKTIAIGAIGVALLVALPTDIQIGFAIWVTGCIAANYYPRIRAEFAAPWTFALFICFIIVLLASKGKIGAGSDFCIGIAAAGLLMGLAAFPQTGQLWKFGRIAAAHVARISYTLYLFHFPLLAFFVFTTHFRQQQPSCIVFLEFTAMVVVTLAISTALWYLFERNTDLLRCALSAQFHRMRTKA
jgi:peptidoglycan/LPS O-acetylase OafA/YrhL